jgi:hypothetical protein
MRRVIDEPVFRAHRHDGARHAGRKRTVLAPSQADAKRRVSIVYSIAS